jgi:hypothetical protein
VKIYDGYIRVSQDRDQKQTEIDQRKRIKDWVDTQPDVELGEIYEDLAVKSRTKMRKRPKGRKIMERLDKGETQGFITVYLDRLTKQTPHGALGLLDEIAKTGGEFVALDQPDKKMRPLMAVIHSMGWEDTKKRIESGERTAQRGGINSGKANVGYRKERDKEGKPKRAGKWEMDPDWKPFIKEAWRMRTTNPRRGIIKEIQRYLAKEGHPLGESDIRYMFTSRAYRGEMAFYVTEGTGDDEHRVSTKWITHLPDGTDVSHPAYVDEATWQKAQIPLARNVKKKNTHEHFGLVEGLATCASCSHRLNEVPYRPGLTGGSYKCQGKKLAEPCTAPSVSSIKEVDRYVVDAINQAKAEGKLRTTTFDEEDLLRLQRERDKAREAYELASEDEERERFIRRYKNDPKPVRKGTDDWRRLVNDRQEELDTIETDVRTAEKTTSPLKIKPGWETRGTLEQRRALVRKIIKKITISQSLVKGGSRQPPIEERLEITLAGTSKPYKPRKRIPGGIELTKWFKQWQLVSKKPLTKAEAEALGISKIDLGNLAYVQKVVRFKNGKYHAISRKDWPQK